MHVVGLAVAVRVRDGTMALAVMVVVMASTVMRVRVMPVPVMVIVSAVVVGMVGVPVGAMVMPVVGKAHTAVCHRGGRRPVLHHQALAHEALVQPSGALPLGIQVRRAGRCQPGLWSIRSSSSHTAGTVRSN